MDFSNRPATSKPASRAGYAFVYCVLLFAALSNAQVPPHSPPLTSARQVLDLGLENARRSPVPVRLEGWITYPDSGVNIVYVQDSSAGIRVAYTNADYPLHSGQRVLVEGTAAGGVFAPFVDCANVRVIGESSVPEPCEAQAARMAAGELFGEWVQVEGVIRDIAKEPGRALLFVASGGLRFHAVIQPFFDSVLPLDWLNARVQLRGVCWTEVDAENKPTGFTLYVPGTNHLFLVRQSQADVFQQAALPINSHPELRRQSDIRVKVTGVVTFHSPDGYVYLQGEGGALRARLLVPLARGNPQARYVERPAIVPLIAGTRVELVGAPTASVFAPLLQDAEFRLLKQGLAPTPVAADVGDVFSGKLDGQFVTMKARLLASELREAGPLKQQVLALQTGDTLFEALWQFTGTNLLPQLAKNSYIQVSGICAVQPGELNHIRSFRLLLREPSDLHLLGRPPWWEPLPVGRILAIAIALGASALVWIWLLRRQVSQRTAQLQTEVAERRRAQADLHDALAAERELSELRSRFVSIVSHEFRTPLGVILSAAQNLDSYFDRLPMDQRRKQLSHVIQASGHMGKVMENVLFLGRAEAGKMEFKPQPLDLGSFCENVANQVGSSTDNRCPIQLRTGCLPLASGDEDLLRHIFSNLLTNAVKYSRDSTPVELSLERQNGKALFQVRDRGIGIPAADQRQLFTAFHRGQNVGQVAGTGLGLVIVKHCVDLHGGEITCESTEGSGTTFTVRLPMFE
jgi:signal transduction histidine kinase